MYFDNYDYDELKEKFVRARFGQDNWYGNPNVETWLEAERRSETPSSRWSAIDRDPLWKFMRRGYDPFDILERYASPIHDAVAIDQRLEDGQRQYGFTLLVPYLNEKLAVYVGSSSFLIVLPESRHGAGVLQIAEDELYHTEWPDAGVLFDVLVAEWSVQASRWQAARKFLCDLVADQIRRDRDEAEREFDEAIAVSDDGANIIPPVSTVVVRDGEKYLAYRNATAFFQHHKIRRVSGVGQTYHQGKKGSFFSTPREFCPPNLPESDGTE